VVQWVRIASDSLCARPPSFQAKSRRFNGTLYLFVEQTDRLRSELSRSRLSVGSWVPTELTTCRALTQPSDVPGIGRSSADVVTLVLEERGLEITRFVGAAGVTTPVIGHASTGHRRWLICVRAVLEPAQRVPADGVVPNDLASASQDAFRRARANISAQTAIRVSDGERTLRGDFWA
jgi:hypothetical protein